MPEEREVEVAAVRKRGAKPRRRAYDSLLEAPLEPRRPLGPELPPQISDEEIYAPLGEARRRIEAAEQWRELAHVGNGELDKAGVVVETGWSFGTDDDIKLLYECLATGALEPDDELMAAAHLDANRLRQAAKDDPRWWRMLLTQRLTVMVERFRPSSDAEREVYRIADNYIYAHADDWFNAVADRSGRNLFTVLQTMTTPVVMVNDQPFIYPGELLDAVHHQEMIDLLNRLIVAAWPLLMMGSIAKNLPIMSTLIDLSLDPGGTASGWWDMISNPGETWDNMMKAKKEHGWNFINPAYWAMVHFYESGESFRRYRETGDPRYALDGLDRMGKGVGSVVDTIDVATGVGIAVAGPRQVANAVDSTQDAIEAANKARRAEARAARAKDAMARSWDNAARVTGRLSANPVFDVVFYKNLAVFAYQMARTGVTTFDAFVKKLKADRLYKTIDVDVLTPDELAAFQEAFATGLRRSDSIPVLAGKSIAPVKATASHYHWRNPTMKTGNFIKADLTENGILTVTTKSHGPKEARRFGWQMMQDVFEYFGPDAIKQFNGKWVRNSTFKDNYDKFLKLINEGKSATEAAWGTWAGEQMKLHGFKRVEIADIAPGSLPDVIEPKFFKDGEPNLP